MITNTVVLIWDSQMEGWSKLGSIIQKNVVKRHLNKWKMKMLIWVSWYKVPETLLLILKKCWTGQCL